MIPVLRDLVLWLRETPEERKHELRRMVYNTNPDELQGDFVLVVTDYLLENGITDEQQCARFEGVDAREFYAALVGGCGMTMRFDTHGLTKEPKWL